MPIIKFEFTKTNIERTKPIIKTENITSILKLISVNKDKLETIPYLKFSFEFEVRYGEIGTAVLGGDIFYTETEPILDQIVKEYANSKQISGQVRAVVYNTIFYKCNIKLLIMAGDVGLPPHFQIPSVKLND